MGNRGQAPLPAFRRYSPQKGEKRGEKQKRRVARRVRLLRSWGRWQPTIERLTEGLQGLVGNRGQAPLPACGGTPPRGGETRGETERPLRQHPVSHYRETRHLRGRQRALRQRFLPLRHTGNGSANGLADGDRIAPYLRSLLGREHAQRPQPPGHRHQQRHAQLDGGRLEHLDQHRPSGAPCLPEIALDRQRHQ